MSEVRPRMGAGVRPCGLVACADPGTGLPISDADASTFDDDTATGDVTSDAQPAGDGKICEPPSALGAPPLTLLDSFDVTLTEGAYYLTHLLDIEVDPASGRIYAAGVGGVCVFEDDGESVSLLGIIGDLQSPDRIELVGPDRYVASAPEGGLMVFDASDPAHPVKLGGKALLGASGAAWANGLLYQLTHTGSLLVLDVATGGPIPTLALVEGLAHPWDLTVEGDYAFVADHVMGLVVLDLTLPLEPTIVAVASELAGVHEVAVDGDRLYAAVGSAGLQIVDVSDPTSPILMGGVATGGALISVTPAGDRVWGADQRDVVVFDVADPDAPSLLAGHETDEWAMHVHADGDRAWVANWRKLDLYRHDPAVLAPKLRIELGIIYVAAGQSAAQLSLRNQGGAPLEIAHIGATDPRIVIDAAGALRR